MKLTIVALLALVPTAAEAVHASGGCKGGSSLKPGRTHTMTGTIDGVKRTWMVWIPKSYTGSKAVPLVVSTHGFSASASLDEFTSGLSSTNEEFIAVYADGKTTDRNKQGHYASWNAAGSTQSPGSLGQTCTASADANNEQCYYSCNGCPGATGCDWTTCFNDVTPTGIGKTDVNGFIPQLYDYMEDNFCIDTTREYHSGFSNGGMLTYQVGVSMSKRVAAIAPVAGSLHHGFNQAPAHRVPVLDLHGASDRTVPANNTVSSDGWKYTEAATIASGWVKSNGCTAAKKRPYEGDIGISESAARNNKLGCVDWGCETVTCSWSGGHSYFGGFSIFANKNSGKLLWGFLKQYDNDAHIGKGLHKGESLPADYELRLTNVSVVPEAEANEDEWARFSDGVSIDVTTTTDYTFDPTSHHYGNPAAGCLPDEEEVTLTNGMTTGSICAPKRNASSSTTSSSSSSCTLGGMQPDAHNGCPTNLPTATSTTSSAFPQCLAKTTTTTTTTTNAHCFLTCSPCRPHLDGLPCSQEADDLCPDGAVCLPGTLRNQQQGLCVFVH